MCPELETTLYHGSLSKIVKIDVEKGRPLKDFGRGFYMAVSPKQAIGLMEKKYRETRNRCDVETREVGRHLYEITLNRQVLERLNIKYFPKADMEWLDFVLMCRGSFDTPHDYDMVIGPTADDGVRRCINLYNLGDFGKKGANSAKRSLMDALHVENLGIQYFIGKQGVVDSVIEDVNEIEWRAL